MRGTARKAGMAPGTLVHIGERRRERTRFELFEYRPGECKVDRDAPLESLRPLPDDAGILWINVDGLTDVDAIEALGKLFDVHPLVLEDLLNTEQRPKLDILESSLFLVLKMLRYDDAKQEILVEQVSFVLGRNYLLTFQEEGGDVFDNVRKHLREGHGQLRKLGADYLLYALLDAIIDNYFVILEKLGDRIEVLEEELTETPSSHTVQEIHRFKRQLIFLRKSVWPLREVIGGLERVEHELIHRETRIFLRDVYDHTIQTMDTVETYRDLLAGMLDLYLSTISNRMNAIMKVLTIIATIFIPLTFIASVYGMNLKHMPWLDATWAFPVLMLFMLLIALFMLLAFKKRHWF